MTAFDERTMSLKSIAGKTARFGPAQVLLRMLAGLTLAALLIGACSSGDDDSSSPSGEPTSAATGGNGGGSQGGGGGATGSEQPTAAPSDGGSQGSGSSVPNVVDLTSLPSFRWDITISGAGSLAAGAGIPSIPGGGDSDTFSARGAWIAPDQAQVEVEISGFAYKQTIKGDQEWTSIAGVSTGPVPSTTEASSLILSASFAEPGDLVTADQIDCGGSENVNGVNAIRCEASEAAQQQFAQSLGQADLSLSDSSLAVWIAADGGYVVRWELKAAGTSDGESFELSVVSNVTDVGNVSSIDP